MLSSPFSQSWQLFPEIKDLLAYDGSSFSLKNTVIGCGEMIKNIVIFFAASYQIPDIPGSFIQTILKLMNLPNSFPS